MEVAGRQPRAEQSQVAHQRVAREGQEAFQAMEDLETPHPHASADFQKALDAVVPSCLVLKFVLAHLSA